MLWWGRETFCMCPGCSLAMKTKHTNYKQDGYLLTRIFFSCAATVFARDKDLSISLLSFFIILKSNQFVNNRLYTVAVKKYPHLTPTKNDKK
jgi:hypothetical protein